MTGQRHFLLRIDKYHQPRITIQGHGDLQLPPHEIDEPLVCLLQPTAQGGNKPTCSSFPRWNCCTKTLKTLRYAASCRMSMVRSSDEGRRFETALPLWPWCFGAQEDPASWWWSASDPSGLGFNLLRFELANLGRLGRRFAVDRWATFCSC